jgi:AraC-like DNA-binding protein
LIGQIFASRKQSSSVQTAIEKRISEARIFILENLNTKISQEEIARQVGLGYSLYRKKFREITGFSPASYQMQMRLNIARHLLLSSAKSVKEISANLGYESTDYFCKYFKQKTGMTPSEYREGKR